METSELNEPAQLMRPPLMKSRSSNINMADAPYGKAISTYLTTDGQVHRIGLIDGIKQTLTKIAEDEEKKSDSEFLNEFISELEINNQNFITLQQIIEISNKIIPKLNNNNNNNTSSYNAIQSLSIITPKVSQTPLQVPSLSLKSAFSSSGGGGIKRVASFSDSNDGDESEAGGGAGGTKNAKSLLSNIKKRQSVANLSRASAFAAQLNGQKTNRANGGGDGNDGLQPSARGGGVIGIGIGGGSTNRKIGIGGGSTNRKMVPAFSLSNGGVKIKNQIDTLNSLSPKPLSPTPSEEDDEQHQQQQQRFTLKPSSSKPLLGKIGRGSSLDKSPAVLRKSPSNMSATDEELNKHLSLNSINNGDNQQLIGQIGQQSGGGEHHFSRNVFDRLAEFLMIDEMDYDDDFVTSAFGFLLDSIDQKERDLDLAADLGHGLLIDNDNLTKENIQLLTRIDELETECAIFQNEITRLRVDAKFAQSEKLDGEFSTREQESIVETITNANNDLMRQLKTLSYELSSKDDKIFELKLEIQSLLDEQHHTVQEITNLRLENEEILINLDDRTNEVLGCVQLILLSELPISDFDVIESNIYRELLEKFNNEQTLKIEIEERCETLENQILEYESEMERSHKKFENAQNRIRDLLDEIEALKKQNKNDDEDDDGDHDDFLSRKRNPSKHSRAMSLADEMAQINQASLFHFQSIQEKEGEEEEEEVNISSNESEKEEKEIQLIVPENPKIEQITETPKIEQSPIQIPIPIPTPTPETIYVKQVEYIGNDKDILYFINQINQLFRRELELTEHLQTETNIREQLRQYEKSLDENCQRLEEIISREIKPDEAKNIFEENNKQIRSQLIWYQNKSTEDSKYLQGLVRREKELTETILGLTVQIKDTFDKSELIKQEMKKQQQNIENLLQREKELLNTNNQVNDSNDPLEQSRRRQTELIEERLELTKNIESLKQDLLKKEKEIDELKKQLEIAQKVAPEVPWWGGFLCGSRS